MKIDIPPEKQVRHLTLLRQPRSITPAEFNVLPFDERLEIIRTRKSLDKYRLLCEAKDGREIIARLTSQDLFIMAKDLGLREFADLLDMVTPEQFTHFLDFDCWKKDRLDLDKVFNWLEALLEGTDADKIYALLRDMDRLLLIFIVKYCLEVLEENAEKDEELDPPKEGENPEGFKIAESILKIIRTQDEPLFQQLLFAAVSEQKSILEEEMFRFQQARLQDQGFPEVWEARQVYAFLDPKKPTLSKDPGCSFGFPEGKLPPGFADGLDAASGLPALAPHIDQEQVLWETVFLVNKVLAADGLALGNSEHISATLETIRDYLAMGREYVLDKHGEAVLSVISQENLFRLGFSLTLQLKKDACELADCAIGSLLDGPFRTFLTCLKQPKPCFYAGMENPLSTGSRRFSSLGDLATAGQWLAKITIQKHLFENHFGFDLHPFRPGNGIADEPVVLSEIFLTALANRLLNREFTPRPLTRQDLPLLHEKVSRDNKVCPKLREETTQWLESLETGGSEFADFCFEVWDEEFCPVRAEDLEPGYIGGLLTVEE